MAPAIVLPFLPVAYAVGNDELTHQQQPAAPLSAEDLRRWASLPWPRCSVLRAIPLAMLAAAELPKCVAAAEAEERLAAPVANTDSNCRGAEGVPADTSKDVQAAVGGPVAGGGAAGTGADVTDCRLSRWAARKAAELAVTSLEGSLAEASPGGLCHHADSSKGLWVLWMTSRV